VPSVVKFLKNIITKQPEKPLSLLKIMKNLIFLQIMSMLLLFSCKKEELSKISGTATINNNLELDINLQTYIGYGFLFSEGKLVTTTGSPKPDITIGNDGSLTNLILQTDNYKDSFYIAGEYTDAISTEAAFDALTSFTFPTWESWAYSIKPNQIWIFRTSAEKYAKIRIISTISEVRNTRDYAECTFEWVYQPDGSLTFPGK
jgi:hypothetical protein